jgi:hypothetical protein
LTSIPYWLQMQSAFVQRPSTGSKTHRGQITPRSQSQGRISANQDALNSSNILSVSEPVKSEFIPRPPSNRPKTAFVPSNRNAHEENNSYSRKFTARKENSAATNTHVESGNILVVGGDTAVTKSAGGEVDAQISGIADSFKPSTPPVPPTPRAQGSSPFPHPRWKLHAKNSQPLADRVFSNPIGNAAIPRPTAAVNSAIEAQIPVVRLSCPYLLGLISIPTRA